MNQVVRRLVKLSNQIKPKDPDVVDKLLRRRVQLMIIGTLEDDKNYLAQRTQFEKIIAPLTRIIGNLFDRLLHGSKPTTLHMLGNYLNIRHRAISK